MTDDKRIKSIQNAIYRAEHREELNRKQRERYANNWDYRKYQKEYGERYRKAA